MAFILVVYNKIFIGAMYEQFQPISYPVAKEIPLLVFPPCSPHCGTGSTHGID